MLFNTRGIVLRSIKYGETSLIVTLFTEQAGVQTYLVQGVRSSKAKQSKAGMLQPASLLELTAYQRPFRNLQRLREFQPAHIYTAIQGDVIRNTIALFSVELLFRLLPEQAPLPEIFAFCFSYFEALDGMAAADVANFPVYFIIQCSRGLGYPVLGRYSEETPYLHLQDGGFSSNPPLVQPFMKDEDARMLSLLLDIKDFSKLREIGLNGPQRFRLLEWFIQFLQQHAQHLGQMKSLPVLQAILH